MLNIKIKKINPNAKIPTKAFSSDAGIDLYAVEEVFIPFGKNAKVATGIAIEMPREPHMFGKIEDRSSMASKGLMISAGIVDSSYRGEVSVVINNFCHIKDESGILKGYRVNRGDKVAQLIFHSLPEFNISEVKELDETSRGNKGFGSSGK